MTELSKQELLIKIMGMTTSDNDNQALVALRKANQLLTDAGWSWEKLIQGRIKVVENPFKSVNPFADKERVVKPQGAAPVYRPTPTPTPRPAPPPQSPPHYATASNPLSIVTNKFANFCYCCGKDTPAGFGFLFDPWKYVRTATSKWQVACVSCNTSGVVQRYPANPVRNKKKASVTDLA